MAEAPRHKARVAVFISGTGTNLAALIYASKLTDCPYEVVLVASNAPDAPGLSLAEVEGIATFTHSHKGHSREDHTGYVYAWTGRLWRRSGGLFR